MLPFLWFSTPGCVAGRRRTLRPFFRKRLCRLRAEAYGGAGKQAHALGAFNHRCVNRVLLFTSVFSWVGNLFLALFIGFRKFAL